MKIWEIYFTDLYDRADQLGNTDVGPEEGVDADEKTYILNSVIDKAITVMRDKNTTGDKDIRRAVL